jgi:hypothetical protein
MDMQIGCGIFANSGSPEPTRYGTFLDSSSSSKKENRSVRRRRTSPPIDASEKSRSHFGAGSVGMLSPTERFEGHLDED